MNLRVVSYNARGLRVGHSEADKSRRVVVDELLLNCDVLCLQETFLARQDLEGLSSVHDDFHGAGESTTDLSTKIVRGRIPGGVAILWNKKYDSLVNVVRMDVDWAIGIEFNCSDKRFIILNVYMPYECTLNEDEYLNRLACIMSFIQENASTCIYVVGDQNADISDDNALFGNHLLQFCTEYGLILSSKALLPSNSYTYISEAWHSTSWLDHCISTVDAHDSLQSMHINYNLATTDHIPLSMSINVGNLPLLSPAEGIKQPGKLDWSKATKHLLEIYQSQTNALLDNIKLPKDAILCHDLNCSNPQHSADLCTMYEHIVESLLTASKPLHKHRVNGGHARPGWNKYVAELHADASRAFRKWSESGKIKSGLLFEEKKKTNANFKYALRFIKRQENTMRADALANKLQNNSTTDFWKEIRTINNCKTSLPSSIDDASSPVDIQYVIYGRRNSMNYSTVFQVKNVKLVLLIKMRRWLSPHKKYLKLS